MAFMSSKPPVEDEASKRVAQRMEYGKTAREVKNQFQSDMFDPKYAGLELTGLFAPGGGLVSNIARGAARRSIIEGMKKEAGGTLKQYKGLNPLKRWWMDAHRKRAASHLRQVNKLPQEMLDPVNSVKMSKSIKAKGEATSLGDITLHPLSPTKGSQTLSHETHHVFTRSGNKLNTLNKNEIRRALKSKILTLDSDAHHYGKTYQKRYWKIGNEAAARDFEQRTMKFTQDTPMKNWLKAYEESLDTGLKKTTGTGDNWFRRRFSPSTSPFAEMATDTARASLKRRVQTLRNQAKTKAQIDWYQQRWDKIQKGKK